MSLFIENVNSYLSYKRIKQTYISLKTGIEPSKLSRLLTENQDITSNDMGKIASALGQRIDFFLMDDFEEKIMQRKIENEVAFYAGEPNVEQQKFALRLIDLIENADEVLGAKERLLEMCREEM